MAAVGGGCCDGVAPLRLRLLIYVGHWQGGCGCGGVPAALACMREGCGCAGVHAPVSRKTLYGRHLGEWGAMGRARDVHAWPVFLCVSSCFRWWVLFGRLHGGWLRRGAADG